MRGNVKTETVSIWVYMESMFDVFANPHYQQFDSYLLVSTNPKNLHLWSAYFQRFDRSLVPQPPCIMDYTL